MLTTPRSTYLFVLVSCPIPPAVLYNLNNSELFLDDNECDSNPCGIHTCNNNEGSYTCTCNTGYHSSTTTTCVDTNECVSGHECDQQCTNNEGSYTCSCGTGYLLDSNGKACNDINECDNNPCHLQADCGNTDGSFTCACFEGYLGDGFNCQPICEYNCLNGGECVEPNTCQCTERFQGPVCAEPVCDECVNGVCVAETDVNVCSCSEGYKGTSCSEDIDECTEETHRCSDICINTVGSFECDCPTGYKLDDTGFTCTDHNECEGDDHGCDICFNLIGSYHCVCELGYQLIAPENKKCEDTDECTMETDICEQVCINKPGGYDCDCNVGYKLEGDEFNCEDVDECAMSTHNCDHGCSNTDGSFTCFCDNGYELGEDGASCLDINECELNTHDCEHICNNNVGSYVCECNAGYSLMENIASCENINECELGTPCHAELGICDDTIGSYECSCVDGYHGDGVDCTDIDECETETHDCHHNCENNPGSFDCSCEEGFHLTEDLKTCREIVNLWTVSRTGCPCYWDKTRTADCACCIEGGCQCTSKNPNKCVQCGYGEDCKYDIMEEAAPCFFNRTRRVSRLVTDLVKPMSCDLRGRYKAKQCEGTKCWCVNTMGHKIPGTEKSGEHRHQLDCENLYFLNGWTAAATGCECPFDKTRTDCACCAEGGCFCGEIDIHMCTQCGITRNCDSLHEDYPPDLRFPML
nr:fibrillin-1-like isoform X1 [Ciona intestinalis]|eukprot:XP_026690224.1 fibrillin-1-like isoform X1 [Ciona intestinalis]